MLVPASQSLHANHERAWVELETRLNEGQRMLLAVHALVETYSVLTRLPPSLRLNAATAERLIRQSYADNGEVVALATDGYLRLLADLAASGIAGGRTYDAVVAETARAAGADVTLTFNVRDFAGLGEGMEVLAPSGVA